MANFWKGDEDFISGKPTIKDTPNDPENSGSVLDHYTADMENRVKRDVSVAPGRVYLMVTTHWFTSDEFHLVKIEQSYQKDQLIGTQTHVIVTDLMTGEKRDVDLSDVNTYNVKYTNNPARTATLRIQMNLDSDADTMYDFEQK